MVTIDHSSVSEAGLKVPHDLPFAEIESRLNRIQRARYVEYQAGSAILERLKWLYDHPQVPRPPCSLIYGDTNNGKTALAYKFIKDRAPQGDTPDNGKRPVVYAHAPPYADVGGFYDAILRSMNAPHRPTAKPQAKWSQVLQLLTNVGTRLLIIDEVGNLLIGKPDQRLMVLNSLKSLSNELQIPVVAIGTQDAVRVFQTDQQLGNRFEPIGIPRWKLTRDYAIFVARFMQNLELKKESDARSRELMGRIHAMSEGLTGETCKLLTLAAETAVRSGREVIDLETLCNVPWVAPSDRRRAAR